MASNRTLVLFGGALFLVCFGAAVIRSTGQNFSDADKALANVSSLKPGMTMQDAIAVLHPERVQGERNMTYTFRPTKGKRSQLVHALTPDRYLVMTYEPPKGRSGMPVLREWRLESGSPPQEDVIIGRAFRVGRYTFHY